MSELTERIRGQQAGAPTHPAAVGRAFADWLEEMRAAHGDHPWEQVGRCVFCVPCGERLYQGTIPEGHPVGRRATKPPRDMLGEFRQRWGPS